MLFPYADEAPVEGRKPWANWALIASNIFVFLAVGLRPDYDETVARYGFTPYIFSPVTLLTSMFMHGGWMHLLGNMWFLHLFGDNVENRVGPFKYLMLYGLCGLAGTLSHYAFFPVSQVPSIGASGAIYGVMGLYFFFFPDNRIRCIVFFILIMQVSIRAVWIMGFWAAMEIFSGHMQTVRGSESGVGHLAHAGGFLGGLLLGVLATQSGLVRDNGRHLFAKLSGRAPAADEPVPATEPQTFRGGWPKPEVAPTERILALIRNEEWERACDAWKEEADSDRSMVLPAREQLALALQLDKRGWLLHARDAYERLMRLHSGDEPYVSEARLGLAGMLLHFISRSGKKDLLPYATELLEQAEKTHPHGGRRQLAAEWLERARSLSMV